MLKNLHIRNYALIENLDVDWTSGLSVITGETGAGKSIILGALGLIIGQRADLSSLYNTDKKAIIEATFLTDRHLKPFFDLHDLVYESESLIRRELLPSGKSRAFVNDSPVTLEVLQGIGRRLIDIHNQDDNQVLRQRDYALFVLDALLQNQEDLATYKAIYLQHQNLKKKLQQIEEEQKNQIKERDYKAYLYDELKEIDWNDAFVNQLEIEQKAKENVNHIKEQLAYVSHRFDGDDGGLLNLLREALQALQTVASYNENFESLAKRTKEAFLELKDVFQEIASENERVFEDPERLLQINQTLDDFYRLSKKHQVQSASELMQIKESLRLDIQRKEDLSDMFISVNQELESNEKKLIKQAEILRENRLKTIAPLEKNITEILKQLGIPYANFQIELINTEKPGPRGSNIAHFLFSANKGNAPKPLEKIASGGELSRVQLAIKKCLSDVNQQPTLIFDEIDTGVSGQIADELGNILWSMAKRGQVVCITHLPQMAAKGDHHYKVYKQTDDKQTRSHLKLLNMEERVSEIASMLSANAISNAAKAQALELLQPRTRKNLTI